MKLVRTHLGSLSLESLPSLRLTISVLVHSFAKFYSDLCTKKPSLKFLSLIVLLSVVSLCNTSAMATALPIGATISNTANATYHFQNQTITASSNTLNIIKTIKRTDAIISFFKLLNTDEPHPATAKTSNAMCYADGTYKTLPNPYIPTFNSTPMEIDLAAAHNVEPAVMYKIGEPIYISLQDFDQNIDPTVKESITLTITSNGDEETLLVSETDINTGIFVAAIATVFNNAIPHNCVLSVHEGTEIAVTYADSTDPEKQIIQAPILVDPLGIVFDSQTGDPLNFATVSIVNFDGSPATIYAPDGISAWPNVVTVGSQITWGSSNQTVQLPTGEYWFPYLAPGSYKIVVQTEPNYLPGPSNKHISTVNTIGSRSFVVSELGSYELPFVITGLLPIVRFDIPKDPRIIGTNSIVITKEASTNSAGMGELIQYTLKISNTLNSDLVVADMMPRGFRYVKGSARSEEIAHMTTTVSSNGQRLEFKLGNLLSNDSITIKYLVKVGIDTLTGEALNSAQAHDVSTRRSSNTALARVMIKDDLQRFTNQIIGEVIFGDCHTNTTTKDNLYTQNKNIDLSNIRIFMEDGRYVVTDKNGRFHLDDIDNGSHIVQLDTYSLNDDLEIVSCVDNTRYAGRAFSQFVDLQGGSLWSTNFYVTQKTHNSKKALHTLDETTQVRTSDNMPNKDTANADIYDQDWLDKQAEKFAFIQPEVDYATLSFISILIQHPIAYKNITLLVNGKEISKGHFIKRIESISGNNLLSAWSGVHIDDGKNIITAILKDENGNEVRRIEKAMSFSSHITQIKVIPEKSRLIADGRNPAIIAVRFTDSGNKPAHNDLTGKFTVNSPYSAYLQNEQELKSDLTFNNNPEPTYKISEDGIAYIKLSPTSQAGKVILNFELNGKKQEIESWLKPDFRDWILVGMAEGTLADSKIRQHMENLSASDSKKTYTKDGRGAFYAKGKIKGKWLLTMAYDTAKDSIKKSAEESIDPNMYFTLYGDHSAQYQDGSSSKKLYLRIENSQAYALFGDFDTGLNGTELNNYNRTFTGIKSSGQFKNIAYTVFAAKEESTHVKEEIPGDGTSGPYRLKDVDILLNSESVKLEVRDRRNQSIVLKTLDLTRYVDYDIDYFAKHIIFKTSISNTDNDFNPLFIVVDYETNNRNEGSVTSGGRLSYTSDEGMVKVGITAIDENSETAPGDKVGLDATLKLNEKNKIIMETALTRQKESRDKASAYLLKYEFSDDNTQFNTYYKQQDAAFGLNQQEPATTGGLRQYYASLKRRLTPKLYTLFEVEQQQDINSDTPEKRSRGKVGLNYQHANGSFGVAYEKAYSQTSTGETTNRDIASINLSQRVFKKINTYLGFETVLNDSEAEARAKKITAGIDYNINERVTVFAKNDLIYSADDEKTTRRQVGLRSRLWKGADISTALNNDISQGVSSNYLNYTFGQNYALNPQSNVRFAFEQGRGINNDEDPFEGIDATQRAKGDYTSSSVEYNLKKFSWNFSQKFEYRKSDENQRYGLLSRWYRELKDGISYGFSLEAFNTQNNDQQHSESNSINSELSLAYRPMNSKWSVLDRFIFDYDDNNSKGTAERTRKFINHTRLNYQADLLNQLSMGYSVKHIQQNFDDITGSNTFHFLSTEYRHDVTKKIDVGVRASAIYDQNTGSKKYSYGPSIGFSPVPNSWISAGYNVTGFEDEDFSDADRNDKGWWIRFRLKFDQHTFK